MTEKTPHIAQMSVYTSRAIERLKSGKPGDLITRDAMSAEIGRSCDPGAKGYGNVSSAIRHVEQNFAIVWRWSAADSAYRCLNDSERVAAAGGYINGSRKKLRRCVRVSKTVDVSKLDGDSKMVHLGHCQAAALGLLFTESKSVAKLGAEEQKGRLIEPSVDAVFSLMRQK